MNQKPEDILKCCTCYSETTVLYALTSMGMQGAPTQQLTFAEMLKEVTHIDFTDDYREMPQHICSECSENLETSYDFLKQALSVYEQRRCLVERLSGSQDATDCLQELEIDVEIKQELRDAYETVSELDACVTGTSNDIKVKQKYDTSDLVTEERNSKKAKFKNKNKGGKVMPSSSKSHKAYGPNNAEEIPKKSRNKSSNTIQKLSPHVLPTKPKDRNVTIPCLQCNKIFKNVKNLLRHSRNTHAPRDQNCACPICGTKFVGKVNMYNHIRKIHDKDEFKDILMDKELAYQCDKCPHKYTTKKQLTVHIKLKHREHAEAQSETAAPEQTEQKPEVRPLCLVCGKSFKSKQNLVEHMRRHTGEKPFQCDLCDRVFAQVSNRNAHRRVHTGEKPYTCSICEKSFRNSTNLSSHIRLHTGERPFKCGECESSFIHRNELKRHRTKFGHIEESAT